MKNFIKLLILASLIAVLFALPTGVKAQDPTNQLTTEDGGKVVFGSAYTLGSGETLTGDLVVFGGSAAIEEGAVVEGDVAIFGGSLSVSGHITGSISAMGGSVNLNETAVVDGDVQSMGVVINQAEGALVSGAIIAEDPDGLNLPRVNPGDWFPDAVTPAFGGPFRSFGTALWALLRALALGLMALLIAMLAPHPTRRVTQTITSAPAVSPGIGLLTFVVAPALVLILAITIILIPFSLLGIVVILAAAIFAWTAVGLELGNRLAVLFKAQWAEPVAAGIGAAFLSLVASLISILPCVDWIVTTVALAFGLGAIVLSRFGTQDYPNLGTPSRPAPPAPVTREPSPTPAVMPVIPEPEPGEPAPGNDDLPKPG